MNDLPKTFDGLPAESLELVSRLFQLTQIPYFNWTDDDRVFLHKVRKLVEANRAEKNSIQSSACGAGKDTPTVEQAAGHSNGHSNRTTEGAAPDGEL